MLSIHKNFEPHLVLALWGFLCLVPRLANNVGMWRPNFSFLCVVRQLKCPTLRLPPALIKQKFVTPIHTLFARRGTGNHLYIAVL